MIWKIYCCTWTRLRGVFAVTLPFGVVALCSHYAHQLSDGSADVTWKSAFVSANFRAFLPFLQTQRKPICGAGFSVILHSVPYMRPSGCEKA